VNLKCSGCGKAHHEVRRLVALSSETHICNECVDLCSEIVHDDGGFVKVAASELEKLRAQAQQAALARIWIDNVRQSMARADDELQSIIESTS
jgi:ATP-dependent protease Clp ATPase subunit